MNVPVGRLSLGRIFNVVGSVIDPYIELSLPSCFYRIIPVDKGRIILLDVSIAYTLCHPIGILSCITHRNTDTWLRSIIETIDHSSKILFHWSNMMSRHSFGCVFYIAYLYLNMLFPYWMSSHIVLSVNPTLTCSSISYLLFLYE